MPNKETASDTTALLQGSQLLQKGRADVFRQRERTKFKRIIRAIVVIGLIDLYLWYRYSSGRPLTLPSLPDDWVFLLFPLLILIPVLLMVALPLINGRSPHITVYPEQVESGLTDIKGLDTQVDEVVRSLDVFLGYATFREELGGTPRRGILFEGPPGTGKTYLAKAMAKQAGVPFLFISAPAFQSMWQGMTAYRIRSFFKALRKAARKEGGAIGFIEEIDAIGMSRGGGNNASPDGIARATVENFGMGDSGSMVNELLIQMQSFDQPPLRTRLRAKMIGWVNAYLPTRPSTDGHQVRVPQHPADRGHEPRRLPRRRAGASGPVRPASLLRRAHQAGPRRPDRLVPRSQEPPPAAGRSADPGAHRLRDVRLHAGDDRAPLRRRACSSRCAKAVAR